RGRARGGARARSARAGWTGRQIREDEVTRRSIRRAILLSAALIFLALMLGGCWRQTTPTPGNRCVGAGHWRSGQIWPVTPNVVTPGGAHVDTSGFTVGQVDGEP